MMDQKDSTTEPAGVDFPLYVRILAVFHVLSLLLGPIVCTVLCGVAVFRWVRHTLDGYVIALLLAGIAWQVGCVWFRWWFVRWGRKHWPEPSSDDMAGR